METFFAPPERTEPEVLKKQTELIQSESNFFNILNSIPEMIMVLNSDRQLIFGNKALNEFLKDSEDTDIFSKRPGEILDCIHSKLLEGGCGTSEFCRTCGAAKAIINSQSGTPDVQECRITQQKSGNALDLRVWSSQVNIGGEEFTLFSIRNISDEKRRIALERLFFHDILNTAGGLKGVTDLLPKAKPEEVGDLLQIVSQLSYQLIDEIKAQQMLNSAEGNDLYVDIRPFSLKSLVQEVVAIYGKYDVARGINLILKENPTDIIVFSDRLILRRVIANMVKNALEASELDATVRVCFSKENNRAIIRVNNNTYMPRDIQLQVFKRSFSTKGAGRGLGTYSIKLLTERYLDGQTGFSSTQEAGTTFYISLKLNDDLLLQ